MTDLPLLAEGGFEGWILQILVLVLVGVVSLVQVIAKYLAKRGRERAEGEPHAPSIGDQVSREIRKYLGEIRPEEAPTTVPPPERPATRLVPVAKPPEPVTVEPRRPVVVRPRPKAKVLKSPRGAAVRAAPLTTREGLRQAIISREVLGPPVALRGARKGPSRLTRR